MNGFGAEGFRVDDCKKALNGSINETFCTNAAFLENYLHNQVYYHDSPSLQKEKCHEFERKRQNFSDCPSFTAVYKEKVKCRAVRYNSSAQEANASLLFRCDRNHAWKVQKSEESYELVSDCNKLLNSKHVFSYICQIEYKRRMNLELHFKPSVVFRKFRCRKGKTVICNTHFEHEK